MISLIRRHLPDPQTYFDRLVPAQYSAPATAPAPQPASGGVEAAAALENATVALTSGNTVEGAVQCVQVMNGWPGAAECFKAESQLTNVGTAYARGEVPETALAAIEAQFPQWESLNAWAKYGILSFYNAGVEDAAAAGAKDAIARLAPGAIEACQRFAAEESASPYQISSMEYWLRTAHAVSEEAFLQAVDEVESLLYVSDAPLQRLAGHGALANHYAGHLHNASATWRHRAAVCDAGREIDFAVIYADTTVPAWVKGLVGFFTGVAYGDLGEYDAAFAAFDAAVAAGASGRSLQRLEYHRIRIEHQKNQYSIEGASESYWAYIEQYPKGAFTAKALLDLGGIYTRAGDYDGAALIYEQVLKQFPDKPEAEHAREAITYSSANLYGTVPMADRLPAGDSGVYAKNVLCGPIALQRLLDLLAVPSTVDELAVLAGSDAAGTTVAGLLDAARQKGVTLTAVEAADPLLVIPPFIAFVDNSHFLLAESLKDRVFTVKDGDDSLDMDAVAFAKRWSGLAIVAAPAPSLAAAPQAVIDHLKGATYGPPPDEESCGDAPESSGDAPESSGCCTEDAPLGSPSRPAPPVNFPRGLPGMPVGVFANSGVSSPGVHPRINVFDTSVSFQETDLKLPVDGALSLHFDRSYKNTKGFHRGEFTGSNTVWRTMGEGWTHSYNMFLQTSGGGTPAYVVVVDGFGVSQQYTRVGTTSVYAFNNASAARGDVLTHNVDGTYTLERHTGATYGFSVPTTSSDYYARIESIADPSGNVITLTYDGAVGTGKLTKVSSPSGDVQHLALTYTGNLITKVELKENTNVLQQVQFAYTSNELTTVTDDDSNTIVYTYASDANVSGSRFISEVTDKRGNSTTFSWTYGTNLDDEDEAYKIELTNAAGLMTRYDRSLSSDVCTITNWDSTTQLSKLVHTPVNTTSARSRYKDYYIDTTNYERWEDEYNSIDDLVKAYAPGHVLTATYTYGDLGELLSFTQGAAGPAITYTYPSGSLQPSVITGPDGLGTEITYNSAGQRTLVEHPSLGASGAQYDYDTEGNLVETINPEGDVTQYDYDSVGNPTNVLVDPAGLALETVLTHDDLGNVTARTDPRGKTTYFAYDAALGESGCGCGGGGGNGGKLGSVTDPLNITTEFQYDENGNQTKVIDPLDRETDYAYDEMNRLTTVTSPSGSANQMTFSYNKLGQLVSQTSFESVTTSYEYDHAGHQTEATDPDATVAQAYTSAGQLASVTDGNSHTTSYTYDTYFRPSEVTDPIGKETHSTYDSAGRRTQVAAGVSGDFDPTEFFYNATTGLLEKVRYHAGASYDDANYFYDDAARLIRIEDWLNESLNGNGLRYAYDSAGRMTTLTDYDDSTLAYEYDAAGNVESMTDYHGNETTYTYDDAGRLSSMTAPGSKTWNFAYNALNQPTAEALPNGMATFYSYDTRNRLEKIDHKNQVLFGSTVESFDYTLDDDGNITRIDEHSGAYWVYGYDDRNRLTSATYTTDWGHEADYTYTYDDGDNMTAKSEPFDENFNDENYTGWSVSTGTWSATGASVKNTLSTTISSYLTHAIASPDYELRFSYYNEDTSNANYYTRCAIRNNTTTRVNLLFYPNRARLYEYNGSQDVQLDQDYAYTTAEDTWYDVVVKMDGATIKVYRAERGQELVEILSTTSASVTTGGGMFFMVPANAVSRYDDVKIIDGGTQSTWAMTPNNANELTQMANSAQGTTINFTYDAMGRTTEKEIGAGSAAYSWRYLTHLYEVSSTIPDEGSVTLEYGGDHKLREASVGALSRGFNWNAGWNIIEEEDGSGNHLRLYAPRPLGRGRAVLGDITGSTPASGVASYYLHDHLSSTREIYNASKTATAAFDYSPYGDLYANINAAASEFRFTGHLWNVQAANYLAPARAYSPATSRWLSRDPLGMVDGPNIWAYVENNPTNGFDFFGQYTIDSSCADHEARLGVEINVWCGGLAYIWMLQAPRKLLRYATGLARECNGESIIKCRTGHEGLCSQYAGYSGYHPGSTVTLCSSAPFLRIPLTMGGTVIHEFMHHLGWHHDSFVNAWGIPGGAFSYLTGDRT